MSVRSSSAVSAAGVPLRSGPARIPRVVLRLSASLLAARAAPLASLRAWPTFSAAVAALFVVRLVAHRFVPVLSTGAATLRSSPARAGGIAPPLAVVPVTPRVSGGGGAAVAVVVAVQRRSGGGCLSASAPFLLSPLSSVGSSCHYCSFVC